MIYRNEVRELGTTITIDLKKQKFAGVRAHNKRAGNPSNENIKQELTKYNKRRLVEAYDDIIEDNLGDYVREHDKKSRKSRRFGSVKKLVSKDNYNPEITAVTTFGNKSVKEKLVSDFESQGVSYEQITDAFHKACDKYFLGDKGNGTQSFNERNNGKLRLSEYHTHVDESTFHVHSYVVGCGWTEKGNPAKGWDHALRELYNGEGNNKSRMSRWRSDEDQVFYDCCMHSYEQLANEHGIKFNKEDYNFIRLNPDDGDRGLDMETYQAKQDIKKRELQVANNERDVADATDVLVKFLRDATGSKEKNIDDIYKTFQLQLVNERVDLDVLKKKQDMLEKTYNGLKTQKDNLETDLDTLKTNHEELVKTYNGLKTKKVDLETKISELEENKQSLDSVIADNQAKIDAENQRHLDRMEELKSEHEEAETKKEKDIEDAKSKSSVRNTAADRLCADEGFRSEVGEWAFKNLEKRHQNSWIRKYVIDKDNNAELVDLAVDNYVELIKTSDEDYYKNKRLKAEQLVEGMIHETSFSAAFKEAYNKKFEELDVMIKNSVNMTEQANVIKTKNKVRDKAKDDGLEL